MSGVTVKLVKTAKQANEAYDLTLEMIQTMGYSFDPLRHEFVANLLAAKGHTYMFLATDDGKPVGMATLGVNFGLYDGGPYGFFAGLYVNPDCRRKGIADELYKAIKAKAKQLKLKSVAWFVHDTNKASLTFFEKHGLQRSDFKLHMFLLNGAET